MAASATFALKPGVWFRRGRLLMVSPDKMGTACPLSDRNSTYRPVQISGTGSVYTVAINAGDCMGIASGLLQHTNQRSVEKYYNKGASLDAVRRYQQIIDQLMSD